MVKSLHIGMVCIATAGLLGLGTVRVLRSTGAPGADLSHSSGRETPVGKHQEVAKRDRGEAVSQPDPHHSLAVIFKQPEGETRDRALENFLERTKTHDPKMISEALLASGERFDLQRALAVVISGWMRRSPQACLEWLEESGLEPEQKDFLIQTAYAVWARLEPVVALDSVMGDARSPMVLNGAFAAAADVDFQAAYSAYRQAGAGIQSAVVESLAIIAASEAETETAGLVGEFIQAHPNVSDQIRFGRNVAVIDRALADLIISAAGKDQMRQQLLAGIFGSEQAVRAFGTKERDAGPAGDEDGFSEVMDASQEDARALGNEATR